jgi:hypothetical protein
VCGFFGDDVETAQTLKIHATLKLLLRGWAQKSLRSQGVSEAFMHVGAVLLVRTLSREETPAGGFSAMIRRKLALQCYGALGPDTFLAIGGSTHAPTCYLHIYTHTHTHTHTHIHVHTHTHTHTHTRTRIASVHPPTSTWLTQDSRGR